MHVAVIHRISDPDGYQRVLQEAGDSFPEGLELPYQFASEDGRTMLCVWDAPSVDAVREFVDGAVGDYAENEVFAAEPTRSP